MANRLLALVLRTLPYYSPLLEGSLRTEQLQRGWQQAACAADLTVGRTNRPPTLSKAQIANQTGTAVQAIVNMADIGSTARNLTAQKVEIIVASLGAATGRSERLNPSEARLTIDWSPPQLKTTQAQSHHHTFTPTPTPLEELPIWLDKDRASSPASILLSKSLLIGGESESGKSNLIWAIISQINELQVPYRLWVIDSEGGVELSDLQHGKFTRQYADRPTDAERVINEWRRSLDDRLRKMRQIRTRTHTPTPQEPLEILLIDGLLTLKDIISKGPLSPLGEGLSIGRKARHICIALTQISQVAVISNLRDLFPQRICLRTKSSDITDAVLGSGATTDGAQCHRLTSPGDGYVYTDHSSSFELFNAPYVQETISIASGGITAPYSPTPTHRPITRLRQLTPKAQRRRQGRTFLYQLYLPNNDSRPIYVGITDNPRRRLSQHEREWPTSLWQAIDQTRNRILIFPTWDEAKDMETRLIEYWHPIYNVQERLT